MAGTLPVLRTAIVGCLVLFASSPTAASDHDSDWGVTITEGWGDFGHVARVSLEEDATCRFAIRVIGKGFVAVAGFLPQANASLGFVAMTISSEHLRGPRVSVVSEGVHVDPPRAAEWGSYARGSDRDFIGAYTQHNIPAGDHGFFYGLVSIDDLGYTEKYRATLDCDVPFEVAREAPAQYSNVNVHGFTEGDGVAASSAFDDLTVVAGSSRSRTVHVEEDYISFFQAAGWDDITLSLSEDGGRRYEETGTDVGRGDIYWTGRGPLDLTASYRGTDVAEDGRMEHWVLSFPQGLIDGIGGPGT